MVERKLTEKPDFLALAAENSGFFPGYFESQSLNEKIGRYDLLFAAPAIEMVAYNPQQFQQLLINIDTQPNRHATQRPFAYGWLVYLSYESAYLMEPKLSHLINQSEEPLAIAVYCQGCLLHDHYRNETRVMAESDVVADQILANVRQVTEFEHHDIQIKKVNEAPGEDFEFAVTKARDLIKQGDIYQANLSRQYTCNITKGVTPADVFSNLKHANPAPFACLLQCNQFAVISSSPERLLHIGNGMIETRPIAGTRPRSKNIEQDLALIEELINTPKERAEHIMLIDLERNDIGKVCEIGSVEVDELMVIETYQHVHHIVSNVKGRIKNGVSIMDAIKALFPGGTITGCPKIRCMEIIHQIESQNRGAYTGSLGYINHDGQADFNILIRTIGMFGDKIKFNAGAGIVFDSSPQAELAETRHKAKGMLKALTAD
ncbi:MAG: aminodeoxychorismate synthase component I [Marinicella sp.]